MNKSNLSAGLSALCVLLLIALLVMQSKQKDQLQSLRQGQDRFVSDISQRSQDASNTLSNLASQIQSQVRDDLGRAQTARETNFGDMNKRLDDLVESGALFPNKSKPANEAIAFANAALAVGDTNLAKVYYLSAINHAPSEFPALSSYANIVLGDPSSTSDDFDRLKSILQISLYQIPPAAVTNVLALLNEATRRERELLADQSPKPAPVNWQERFEQLMASNTLTSSWTDLKQISKRWDALNDISESLHEEQPESELTKKVQSELDLTLRVLEATRLITALDTMITALTSCREQPEKAASLLQTAESTLGQLWGIDSAGWPAELCSKIDQYPKSIQSYVDAVAEIKSAPFLAKVDAERDSVNACIQQKAWATAASSGHPYQQVITKCDACYERAVAAAQSIFSTESREKAEAAMKQIRNIALDAKRKQFDAYQRWVVFRCKQAFDQYDKINNWYKPTLLDETARNIFDESGLVEVDQSLLAPETARLFDDVLRNLSSHMSGAAQFEMQRDIAQSSKKKQEDF